MHLEDVKVFTLGSGRPVELPSLFLSLDSVIGMTSGVLSSDD